MPSTYSPTFRTELPATGEQNDAWAATVDNNLSVPIEQGLSGISTVNVPDADVTLTTANALTDQARMPVLVFTGALTATRTIIAPQVPKVYILRNNTTGGKNLILRTAATAISVTDEGLPVQYSAVPYSGANTTAVPIPEVVVPPGATVYAYTDGTLFDYCVNALPAAAAADSIVLASPLPIDDGGTGATTQSAARTNLGLGSAALLDADTAATANTAPLRDTGGGFSAGVITAGLQGTATSADNANLLGNLPPPSYSAIDTNWDFGVSLPVSASGGGTIDVFTLMGAGPCLIEFNLSGTNYLQGFYAVPDGTTSIIGVNLPTAIGQFFPVNTFATVSRVYKLRKLF